MRVQLAFFKRSLLPLAFLLIGLAPVLVQAQYVTDYQLTAYSNTYTPLPVNANTVPIITNTFIQAVPIGFSFNFAGTGYTTAYPTADGFISFNPAVTLSGFNELASGPLVTRPFIAPLYDALDGQSPGSRAAYETTGAVGSRVFTFEWANWEWNAFANAAVISFQVKLFEGAGRIEFHYRQEGGTPFNPSASIGLAAAGTGPGNFLSLNNTGANPGVSYLTDVSTLNVRPATGQVYAFSLPPASAIDVRTVALAAPAGNGCFGANQTVKFSIKNYGTAPLDFSVNPLTVSAAAKGVNPQVFSPVTLNTGILAPGALQDVTVSTAYNMVPGGTYRFNASATVTGDGNPANDSLKLAETRIVPPTAALPQKVNFTGFNNLNMPSVYPGWYEANGATGQNSGWSNWEAASNVGYMGNKSAVYYFNSSGNNDWIVSPKLSPGAGAVLRFKAALTEFLTSGPHPTGLTGNDKVQVMVSTDCGLTYTPILTFNAANQNGLTNNLTDYQVSLAPYIGQNLVVAFYASNGSAFRTVHYKFHLDDIFIGTPPPTDLGITAMINPAEIACFGGAENITLTVKNYGTNTLNFVATPAAAQVNVTGATAATLTHTLNTGMLAPGATQNVTLPNTLNMQTAGIYQLTAFNALTADPAPENDSLKTTREARALFPLPQSSTLNGFSGNNLPAVFPGWYEASGFKPVGSLPATSWEHQTGLGSSNNVTVKIHLGSNETKEWIISPKVIPTASTILRFKVAITDYGLTTPDPLGMANSDDKVQVMVSTDCGATFTPIYTFDGITSAGLTNVLTDYSFSLSQYAGQEIMVAFYATDGAIDNFNNYDFHLDDLFIGTLPPSDLGVTAILSPPPSGCYTNAEPVGVTIRNFGFLPVDFANTAVTVTAKVTGTATATLSAVVNTGMLAAGDSLNVNLSPSLNMLAAGTYNLKAYTTILQDNNAANDTAALMRTRYPVSTLPQIVDFTGFTDANLTQLFPAWREATGTVPAGTTSNWKHSIGLGNAANTTAKIYLGSVWEKGWLIGPTFTPTVNTRLSFEAALTEWFNLNADPVAMAGTDDVVQVMISEDCGATYLPIFTFDSASTVGLSNVLTTYTIPLGGFKGKDITIAFFATDGTVDDPNDYTFHLDNIKLSDVNGVKDQSAAQALLVYPNPNRGTFSVNLNGFEKEVALTLSTLTGQQVLARKVSNADNQAVMEVQTQNLKPGIYLLKAVSEKKTRVCRVVVQ